MMFIRGLDNSLWKTVQKIGRVGRKSDEKSVFIFVSEKKSTASELPKDIIGKKYCFFLQESQGI